MSDSESDTGCTSTSEEELAGSAAFPPKDADLTGEHDIEAQPQGQKNISKIIGEIQKLDALNLERAKLEQEILELKHRERVANADQLIKQLADDTVASSQVVLNLSYKVTEEAQAAKHRAQLLKRFYRTSPMDLMIQIDENEEKVKDLAYKVNYLVELAKDLVIWNPPKSGDAASIRQLVAGFDQMSERKQNYVLAELRNLFRPSGPGGQFKPLASWE